MHFQLEVGKWMCEISEIKSQRSNFLKSWVCQHNHHAYVQNKTGEAVHFETTLMNKPLFGVFGADVKFRLSFKSYFSDLPKKLL